MDKRLAAVAAKFQDITNELAELVGDRQLADFLMLLAEDVPAHIGGEGRGVARSIEYAVRTGLDGAR